MKYLFEIILEDELHEIKHQNKIKESLIQVANEEISNLAKENHVKTSTIQVTEATLAEEMKEKAELLKRNEYLESTFKHLSEQAQKFEVSFVNI